MQDPIQKWQDKKLIKQSSKLHPEVTKYSIETKATSGRVLQPLKRMPSKENTKRPQLIRTNRVDENLNAIANDSKVTKENSQIQNPLEANYSSNSLIGSKVTSWFAMKTSEFNLNTNVTSESNSNNRENISTRCLHGVLHSYLDLLVQNDEKQAIGNLTFQALNNTIQTSPIACQYMIDTITMELHLSRQCLGLFIDAIVNFIREDDIQEATMIDFLGFLGTIDTSLKVPILQQNIFKNLNEFFQDVLSRFRQYLVKKLLETNQIASPCQFGKKSKALILCMECNCEHF